MYNANKFMFKFMGRLYLYLITPEPIRWSESTSLRWNVANRLIKRAILEHSFMEGRQNVT